MAKDRLFFAGAADLNGPPGATGFGEGRPLVREIVAGICRKRSRITAQFALAASRLAGVM